jgi:2-dehydropantoate 2-reductase
MSDHRPPITIVGAGGIGGTIAAALTLAGDRVTVVDASVPHIEAIRTRGLHFDGIQGDHYVRFEQALLPAEWEAPAGVVLLAVKSQDTREALRVIAPRLHAGSVVVSLQNGWNPAVIADAVGADRTMAAMIHMVGNHEGPGHVRRYSEGTFHLGELSQTLTPRAVALAERLSAAVPTTATGNPWGFIWSKQICGTTKAATALVDERAADIVQRYWVTDILLALILEGIAAADAEGIRLEAYERLDPDVMRVSAAADLPAARAMLPKGSAKGNSGVWHDLKVRRRKTEVEYLSGELVRIGRRHGLPMAVNGRVVEMIAEIEAGIRLMAWDNLRELRSPAARVLDTALGSVA